MCDASCLTNCQIIIWGTKLSPNNFLDLDPSNPAPPLPILGYLVRGGGVGMAWLANSRQRALIQTQVLEHFFTEMNPLTNDGGLLGCYLVVRLSGFARLVPPWGPTGEELVSGLVEKSQFSGDLRQRVCCNSCNFFFFAVNARNKKTV